jgi:DNA invertase Pin-like site-specific DNA recombinase
MLAMLRDATDDQFDVILAWREDRLYRGMRAMLLVLETIQQHNLTIMLALETFDPATAPLKAWLAQVELDNIKERMTMGVKARLKAGKANSGQDRYGYQRIGESIEIVSDEAKWVRQIFAWYIDRVPMREIRKRLIAEKAPQKKATKPRKITWATSSIDGVLKGAKDYATGIKVQRREGEQFKIGMEPILDMETYEHFLRIRRKPAQYSNQQVKHYYLIQGLLYCQCEYRWQQRGATSHYRNKRGEWVERKTVKGTYFCPVGHEELISPECPRSISRRDADREVWRQVCNAINNPGILLDQARIIASELMAESAAGSMDRERIEKELENISYERQWTITQARKGGISEDEMDLRLNEYSLLEVGLKGELSSMHQTFNEYLLVDWEVKVIQFLDNLKAGIEALNADPECDKEWLAAFELRQEIVHFLVEKVSIDINRQLTVTIHLNLLGLLNDSLKNDGNSGNPNQWPVSNLPMQAKASGKNVSSKSRIGQVTVSAFWNE